MGAAVAGRLDAGGAPFRDAGLGLVDVGADGAQERLSVSELMSPNEWRISGGEPQAKRGGLAGAPGMGAELEVKVLMGP